MRAGLQILGWTLIAIGLPWVWSPIPFGFVIAAPGAALVVATNRKAHGWLRRLRHRYRRLDCALARAERRLPRRMRAVLQSTAGPEAMAEHEQWKARAARRRRHRRHA